MSRRAALLLLLLLGACARPHDRMAYEARFACPPPAALRPCTCSTVPDVPTVVCGRARSLKTVKSALREAFADAPVPYLKLEEARFEGLPSRAFVSLNLTRLEIKDSNLKWIAADAFAGMRSLMLLTLHNVALFSFPAETLAHLSSLVALRLPENKLSALAHGHFRRVSRLKYLSLSDNKLTHVHRMSFPITLVTLSLAHNCLASLNMAVRDLVNLEWLFLNDNRLVDVEGELEGLKSLQHLDLASNAIRWIGTPFDFPYLQELYLQHNYIRELGPALRNLRKLKNLNLAMNRLSRLDARDFDKMVSLQSLDLSGNRIASLNGALHPLSSLRILDLSHNRLCNVSFFEFSTLSELSILDVSDNRLKRLTSEHFELTLPLERLFLARNKLKSLYQFLKHFPRLEALDISFNQIRIIKYMDFTISSDINFISLEVCNCEKQSKKGLRKKTMVTGKEILSNPLLCDEEQMDAYNLLKNRKIEVDGQPKCDIEPRTM